MGQLYHRSHDAMQAASYQQPAIANTSPLHQREKLKRFTERYNRTIAHVKRGELSQSERLSRCRNGLVALWFADYSLFYNRDKTKTRGFLCFIPIVGIEQKPQSPIQSDSFTYAIKKSPQKSPLEYIHAYYYSSFLDCSVNYRAPDVTKPHDRVTGL